MKKLLPVFAILALLFAAPAYAVMGTPTLAPDNGISGDTVYASGNSPYPAIALKSPRSPSDIKGVAVLWMAKLWEGNAPVVGSSGVTVSFYVKFGLEDANWGLISRIPIVENVDIISGATKEGHPFRLQAAPYMRIEVDSGASNIAPTIVVSYPSNADGWYEPQPGYISSTYSSFGTSGVTCVYSLFSGTSNTATAGYDANLIPPDTAQWVAIRSGNADTQWTFNKGVLVPVYDTVGETYAQDVDICIPVAQYKRGEFVPDGVAVGDLRFDWYVDKPF